MKLSPVQLQIYYLSRVAIQPLEEVSLNRSAPSEQPFDWTGTQLNSNVEFGWGDGQGEDLRAFAMKLRLSSSIDEKSTAPYSLDVEAVGYFTLVGDIPLNEREDIARVNGASLLFSALRELVFSITARFPKGALVLPTVNFFDLKNLPKSDVSSALSATTTAVTAPLSTAISGHSPT
jgi:preprotein translocase subunit SecB